MRLPVRAAEKSMLLPIADPALSARCVLRKDAVPNTNAYHNDKHEALHA